MQNLFDKASLVMVPSGYDNGKLYNIKPEDKSSAFEFERATMATRVNSSVLVETMFPEATNLLLQSNQFDTSPWLAENSSTTGGQIGYDGSSDAWLIQGNGLGASRLRQNGLNWNNSVYSLSFYAKAGTENVINIYDGTWSGVVAAIYDLSTGTATKYPISIPIVETKMVSVGNGWWKCSFTAIPNPFTNTAGFVRIGIGSTTAANSGNIYIQDAQLESGAFATPYIETTTQTATRQNQANQPRIDYTSGEGALLLELQRTNLVEHSEHFDEYSNSNTICTSNYSLSPEGANNSTKVRFISSSTNALGQNISVSSGDSITQSVFVKYIDTQFIQLWFGSAGFQGGHANFDLLNNQTLSYSGASSSIESFGNGWYRISVSKQASSSNSNTKGFALVAVNSLNSTRFNDEVDGSVEVFGAQAEVGSYATSYIPTNGQQETRAVDVLSKHTFSATTTKTLFVEFQDTEYTGGGGEFLLEDASDGAVFRIYVNTDSSGGGGVKVRFRSEDLSTNSSFVTNRLINQNQKACFSINGTTAKAFCNGQLVRIFTVTPINMAKLNWRVLNGAYSTKQVVLFDTALSDEESQRLTSLSADATTFTELANNNGYTIL